MFADINRVGADTMPIKIRFFFAAGPVDYRGPYKADAAQGFYQYT